MARGLFLEVSVTEVPNTLRVVRISLLYDSSVAPCVFDEVTCGTESLHLFHLILSMVLPETSGNLSLRFILAIGFDFPK